GSFSPGFFADRGGCRNLRKRRLALGAVGEISPSRPNTLERRLPTHPASASVAAMRVAPRLFFLLALALGCDRKIEPYVPGEEPAAPDLSRIFPRGAEQAKQDEESAAKAGGAASAAAAGPMAGAPPGASAERGTLGPPIRGTVTIAPALVERAPKGAV